MASKPAGADEFLMGTLSDGVVRALEHVPAWAWALPVLLFLAVGAPHGRDGAGDRVPAARRRCCAARGSR